MTSTAPPVHVVTPCHMTMALAAIDKVIILVWFTRHEAWLGWRQVAFLAPPMLVPGRKTLRAFRANLQYMSVIVPRHNLWRFSPQHGVRIGEASHPGPVSASIARTQQTILHAFRSTIASMTWGPQ
eukprot:3449058-Amphidinium_carterae.1